MWLLPFMTLCTMVSRLTPVRNAIPELHTGMMTRGGTNMRLMKLAAVCVAVLFAVGTVPVLSSQAGGTQTAAGWTTLFDGSNLNNWNPIGTANWRLADGGVEAN